MAQRVAILADVHGNVPALEAVLADLEDQGVDEVLVGGDLVGRGPEGSKVVERITGTGWRGVRGNHEDYMLSFRRKQVPEEWLESDEWSAARFMGAELSDEHERAIDALPMSIVSRELPQLRLVHGTTRANTEGLGPWNSDSRIARELDAIEERFLACAHTHRPMERRVGRGAVVNVGAVGLPFNRDQRAQYAIFEGDGAEDGEIAVEFRQVSYDIAELYAIYDRTGFLEAGGATAKLLRLELEHAAPFLVPFLKWAGVRGFPALEEHLAAFLEFYDHEESISEFAHRLDSLR